MTGTFAACSTLCQTYCKETRTHLSLGKDAPVSGCVQAVASIIARLVLGAYIISMPGFDFR
jgi:hypothetical protein